jgi:hypothetical protein
VCAAAAWLILPARGHKVLLETWFPQQRALWRTAIDEHAGLDVALKETAIPARQNRQRIWRGKG